MDSGYDVTPTKNELTVLVLLLQGFSHAEIAAKIHQAERTVKNYLASIRIKAGAVNLGAVALWAHPFAPNLFEHQATAAHDHMGLLQTALENARPSSALKSAAMSLNSWCRPENRDLPISQLAEVLRISPDTLKKHIATIRKAMGLPKTRSHTTFDRIVNVYLFAQQPTPPQG